MSCGLLQFCKRRFCLYPWSFPLDSGLQLQLAHREEVVHEQSVLADRVNVSARRRTPGQEVGQPEARLRPQQLVGTDRVHFIFRQRKGAGRQLGRLLHVKSGTFSTELSVLTAELPIYLSAENKYTEATPFRKHRYMFT